MVGVHFRERFPVFRVCDCSRLANRVSGRRNRSVGRSFGGLRAVWADGGGLDGHLYRDSLHPGLRRLNAVWGL